MTKSEFTPHPMPDGTVELEGRTFMMTADGGMKPIEAVKAQHKLEDEAVRKIMGYALALSAQMSRFKIHTMGDLDDLDAMLAQEYKVKKGGKKGNRTYKSVDGLWEISVRVQDQFEFGPELQAAKALIEECLVEWSKDSRMEIQAIVTTAFETDKKGQLSRAKINKIKQWDITDPTWLEAMRALNDAERVSGSKIYMGFRFRATHGAPLQTITLDLASA